MSNGHLSPGAQVWAWIKKTTPGLIASFIKMVVFPLLAGALTTYVSAQTGVTGLTPLQERIAEVRAERAEAKSEATGIPNEVQAPPTLTAPIEVDGKEKNIPLTPGLTAAALTGLAVMLRSPGTKKG
jgi:hypothetical protein